MVSLPRSVHFASESSHPVDYNGSSIADPVLEPRAYRVDSSPYRFEGAGGGGECVGRAK